jgi:RimJ/RimL family protein N-acetyltransferase
MLKMRKVREEDLKQLLDIINEPGVIEHMPLERPVRMERVRDWFRSFQAFGYPVIFVLELEQVIGACSLRENGKITVWISARHQGKGYGTEAMGQLADYARQQKMKRIWLECQKENERALDFYRKLGFSEIGEDRQNRVMEMLL